MSRNRNKWLARFGLLSEFTLWLAFLVPASLAADLFSYVIVQDDGTLKIRGKIVHLYAIHLPDTERTCRQNVRPIRCTSRAAHALEFKIGSSFVQCERKSTNPDRSLVAQCYLKGEDLSAYLLERGWAVATDDAPFEYRTLERIARSRRLGIWGLPIGEQ